MSKYFKHIKSFKCCTPFYSPLHHYNTWCLIRRENEWKGSWEHSALGKEKKKPTQSLRHHHKLISLSKSALINLGKKKIFLMRSCSLHWAQETHLMKSGQMQVWLQPKLHKVEISKSGKIKFWVKKWLEHQVVLYLIQMLCSALCHYNMSAFSDWRNSHWNSLT